MDLRARDLNAFGYESFLGEKLQRDPKKRVDPGEQDASYGKKVIKRLVGKTIWQ